MTLRYLDIGSFAGANHPLGDLRLQLREVRRPKARSPEDRLCWSSSWNDDGTGTGHDFPGSYHFLTLLGSRISVT